MEYGFRVPVLKVGFGYGLWIRGSEIIDYEGYTFGFGFGMDTIWTA